MCGRYVSTGSVEDLCVLLGVNPFEGDETGGAMAPAFNLAPTDRVPAVLRPSSAGRQLHLLTWGLVPPWADPTTGARRINARIETVAEKPSFRRAVRTRRCLLPADGWYEWTTTAAGRQPHLVRRADGVPLAFAGLWESWHAPDGSVLRTCSIITGPAPAGLAWLHDRAPVAVPPELQDAWLDSAGAPEPLLAMLSTASRPPLDCFPVSRAVNAVRNDGPALVEPVALALQPELF